jgi:spore coat protein CotH
MITRRAAILLLPLSLTAACEGGDGPSPDDSPTEAPTVTTEIVEDQDLNEAWIFSDEVIHEIDLTISAASVSALQREPREDVEAEMTFNGEALDPVGLRLAGKVGSFRELSGKPKLRIDFNKLSEGQRFYGLEGLALNNQVVDCSYMREATAYRVFREHGAPGSRTGWAHVTLNGSDYGLYLIVESPDDRYLKQNFAEPDGNLYDGKYLYDWDTGYYTLLDLYDELVNYYELEEGQDVAHADLQAITDALDAHTGAPSFYEALGELVDWPSVHQHLALEQIVGHNDGYALNWNNNRLYFDPNQQGRMTMLTWDLDNSFLIDYEWGFSWSSPNGRLVYWCWQDATCKEAQRQAVIAVLDATDIPSLLAWYDTTAEMTLAAAESDPRKEFDNNYLASCRIDARQRINRSKRLVKGQWGIE